MSIDLFKYIKNHKDDPATDAFVITPHDTNELVYTSRALYIGGSGDVKVTTADGTDITFVGVSGILPIRVKRVFSTGTTATSIVGLV